MYENTGTSVYGGNLQECKCEECEPFLFKLKAGVNSQLLASRLPEGLSPLCFAWVLLPLERLVAF